MYRYAQILNNRVHWIIEEEMTLEELYQHKFNPNNIQFVDVNHRSDVQEGWSFDGSNFAPPVVHLPTLDELKTIKWQEIKAARDRMEQSGVPYLNKILDSDPTSVQRISIAAQAAQVAVAAGQQFSIDWTCADNTTVSLTAAQVIGMPVALAQYANSLHITAREIKAAIDAAETAEEVNAICWPT